MRSVEGAPALVLCRCESLRLTQTNRKQGLSRVRRFVVIGQVLVGHLPHMGKLAAAMIKSPAAAGRLGGLFHPVPWLGIHILPPACQHYQLLSYGGGRRLALRRENADWVEAGM